MAGSLKYQVVNGVSYKLETSDLVVQILEQARSNGTRLTIKYGEPKTGKFWNRTDSGYIGRGSTTDHLPILLHSKKAGGGICVMDASVLEIREAKTGKVLYSWLDDPKLITTEILVDDTESVITEINKA